MDSASVLVGVLLGAVGVGYIVYGRRQMCGAALVSGILLCVFPYFVANIWLVLLIAAALMLLPRYVDF